LIKASNAIRLAYSPNRSDDWIHQQYHQYHRPLKIRTDGGHAQVCKPGSIGIFSFLL